MSLHSNLAKLRKSCIPPFTYTTNFVEERLEQLRDRVTSQPFMDAIEQENPVNLYLYAADANRANMRRVCMAVGLVAKALCLRGQKIVHCTLAGMLREIRFNEMEREQHSFNPVMEHIGTGYIAIGDFLEFTDVEQKYGYHAVQLVADYLATHLQSGGGLILGAAQIERGGAYQFGSFFGEMLEERFESFRIE
jgi:hypothetical protein